MRRFWRTVLPLPVLFAALAWMGAPANAEDVLKVAIGQITNWENQPATLGVQAGIFQKHGLTLQTFGTQGAGETLQPIISGSADIGVGVGTSGAMRAFAKGAPVRVLGAGITGASALYWYVRGDSPIHSLKDLTENNTIAYSTSGAVTNTIVLAFVSELGANAKPTATGGPPSTLTQVMSGQIDVGWRVPPLGIEEAQQGKIRIIARGSDLPAMRDLTLTVLVWSTRTRWRRRTTRSCASCAPIARPSIGCIRVRTRSSSTRRKSISRKPSSGAALRNSYPRNRFRPTSFRESMRPWPRR